jgi:hypothetical protein
MDFRLNWTYNFWKNTPNAALFSCLSLKYLPPQYKVAVFVLESFKRI